MATRDIIRMIQKKYLLFIIAVLNSFCIYSNEPIHYQSSYDYIINLIESNEKTAFKYNLTASGVDNVSAAIAGDNFAKVGDENISYGNRLGTSPNEGGNGEEFGSANGHRVDINPDNIVKGISEGYNQSRLISSTFIHEIGHNLGLDHSDKTRIMDSMIKTEIISQIGGNTTTYSYPALDKKGAAIMVRRINAPRVGVLGILRTQ